MKVTTNRDGSKTVISSKGNELMVDQEWGEQRWNVMAKRATPCKLFGSEWSWVDVFNSEEEAISYANRL